MLLLLLCSCTFFFNLPAFFPDIMESRNFITAREMVTEGNWIYTTMNLEPRLEKPPLPTWLTAFSAMLFGGFDSLLAMRLPAALSATLMVLFFYAYLKEITEQPYLPLLGGMVLGSSLLVVQQARINSWDIYTHSFMMGSIWLWVRHLNNKRIAELLLSALFMGLSILSKGPIGLYTLWLPFILSYFFFENRQLLAHHWKKLLPLLLLAVMIGISWNLINYFYQPAASEFVANKEVTAWTERHVRPFYFYLHFPIYIGIWAVFLIATLFYKYAAPRINSLGNYRFALGWMLLAVLLLSIFPTKKERYLLPVSVPMALLATYMIYALIRRWKNNNLQKWDKRLLNINSLIIFPAFLLGSIALAIIYPHYLSPLSIMGLFLLCLTAVAGLFFWKKKKILPQIALIVLLVGLSGACLPHFLAHIFYDHPDFKSLTEIRKLKELKHIPFYSQGEETDPRLVWQAGKAAPLFRQDLLENEDNFPMVLITYNELAALIPQHLQKNFEIQDYGKYDLMRKEVSWQARVFLVNLKK
jgi:4-amino-4-deoxy-L-arabinose transferase-like glycosyltransferase